MLEEISVGSIIEKIVLIFSTDLKNFRMSNAMGLKELDKVR